MQQKIVHIVLGLLLATSTGVANVSSDAKKFADDLGAHSVIDVTFDRSQTQLSDSQRMEINQALMDARLHSEVSRVKVLAWSDHEYPQSKNQASKTDQKLANARLDNLRDYLKDDLSVNNVDSYNMAERPNRLEEVLKTSDARIKESAEKSGAAPGADRIGVFNWKGQASKALLLIFVKE